MQTSHFLSEKEYLADKKKKWWEFYLALSKVFMTLRKQALEHKTVKGNLQIASVQ